MRCLGGNRVPVAVAIGVVWAFISALSVAHSTRAQEAYNPQSPSHLDVEQDRWSKYVPARSGTLAEELRAARESERRQRERAQFDEYQRQRRSRSITSSTGLRQGVSAVRRATGRVKEYLDGSDEEDESDGHQGSTSRATGRRSIFGQVWSGSRQVFWLVAAIVQYLYQNAFWTPMTYVASAARWSAGVSWHTTQWTSERAFFAPIRTASAPLVYLVEGLLFIFVWIPGRAVRAIVRELYPVYVFLGAALAVGTAMGIAAAIVLYVGSFVLSDRSTLERELYERSEQIPDELEKRFKQSTFWTEKDDRLSKQGEVVSPADRFTSAAKKQGRSIIEQAIRESLQREKRASKSRRRQNGSTEEYDAALDEDMASAAFESAWQAGRGQASAPDSDEEDDYFGDGIDALMTSARKGSRGSKTSSSNVASGGLRRSGGTTQSSNILSGPSATSPPATAAAAAAASPYGRTLPLGATAQGGWNSRSDSNSSTPMASPMFTRSQIAPSNSTLFGSGGAYGASARSHPPHSPFDLTSPSSTIAALPSRLGADANRPHVRQRTGNSGGGNGMSATIVS